MREEMEAKVLARSFPQNGDVFESRHLDMRELQQGLRHDASKVTDLPLTNLWLSGLATNGSEYRDKEKGDAIHWRTHFAGFLATD